MNELTIEQANLEDLPQLTDLLFDLFSHEADFKPDRDKQMRGIQMILDEPSRGRIFVVRQNGTILALINLLFITSTVEGGTVILLEDLVVHRDHRHQGFGEKLLSYAIHYAKEKEITRITLLTDLLDKDSQRFFHNHGFVDSGMIPMRCYLNPADPD